MRTKRRRKFYSQGHIHTTLFFGFDSFFLFKKKFSALLSVVSQSGLPVNPAFDRLLYSLFCLALSLRLVFILLCLSPGKDLNNRKRMK